jgi:hypothetical protein
MPILIETFCSAQIDNGAFIPQFECIIALVRVSGQNIVPFADRLLNQVISIAQKIGTVLKVSSPRHKSKDRVLLEYELNNNLMRCFDFIASLSESIPEDFAKLSSAKIVPELVFAFFETDNNLLKQIVYSVIGDLLPIMDKAYFEPYIDKAIALLVQDAKVLPASMDPGKTYLSIATNSLYAFSEVLEKFPERVKPHLVLEKLLKIYENPKVASLNSSFTSSWR